MRSIYLQPNTRRIPLQKQESQQERFRASRSPHSRSRLSSQRSSRRSLQRFMHPPLLAQPHPQPQPRRSVSRSATMPQEHPLSLYSTKFLASLASLLKPQHILFSSLYIILWTSPHFQYMLVKQYGATFAHDITNRLFFAVDKY